MDLLLAILIALLLLLAGEAIRRRTAVLKRIFLPSSIVAGGIGLLLGPQVLGRLANWLELPGVPEGGLFPATMLDAWTVSVTSSCCSSFRPALFRPAGPRGAQQARAIVDQAPIEQ